MSTQASEPAQAEAPWTAAARGSRKLSEDQIRTVAQELTKLPGDGGPRATRLLNELAATEPSPAGLKQAATQLEAALPGFITPGPRPPGQDPSQRRLTRAAHALLLGRVHRIAGHIAAQKEPKAAATELLRAIESAHQALRGANADRGLEWEAREGLGHVLYEAAAAGLPVAGAGPR